MRYEVNATVELGYIWYGYAEDEEEARINAECEITNELSQGFGCSVNILSVKEAE